MEKKLKRRSVVSLVFTFLTLIFFSITIFFGVYFLYSIFDSNNNELAEAFVTILMLVFLLFSLVPSLLFSLLSIGFCISPLKNKYHTKANIVKLVFNILVIVVSIGIFLFVVLRK